VWHSNLGSHNRRLWNVGASHAAAILMLRACTTRYHGRRKEIIHIKFPYRNRSNKIVFTATPIKTVNAAHLERRENAESIFFVLINKIARATTQKNNAGIKFLAPADKLPGMNTLSIATVVNGVT